jgi:hypothetical protein
MMGTPTFPIHSGNDCKYNMQEADTSQASSGLMDYELQNSTRDDLTQPTAAAELNQIHLHATGV